MRRNFENSEPVKEFVTEKHSFNKEVSINGIYFRNGPNSYLDLPNEHLFDGDGMIHHAYFEYDKGVVSYGNDYIQTNKLVNERKYNTPFFYRIGYLNLITIISWFIKRLYYSVDPFLINGEGNANTAIVHHAGRLLALNEADYPYEVSYDTSTNRLKTIGRYTFGNKLTHNVNAHPKIDPVTNEMFLLGYDLFKSPYCKISIVNSNGELTQTFDVELPLPIVIHDFSITENHIILMDLPLTWSISRLLTSTTPIYYDMTATCRIGLINRDTLNIKWFVLREKTVIFHFVNSWEEDNILNIYAICYDYLSFDIYNLDKQHPVLKLFKVDLLQDPDTFIVDSSIVSHTPCEFPSIHSDNVGRYTEHFYYLKMGLHGFDGIIKYNTITKKETILKLKDGYTCGEVSVMDNERLITYVYNSVDKLSAIHVYDGEMMNEIPLLVVPLNHRIPIGFHGQFIKYNSDTDIHFDNPLTIM